MNILMCISTMRHSFNVQAATRPAPTTGCSLNVKGGSMGYETKLYVVLSENYTRPRRRQLKEDLNLPIKIWGKLIGQTIEVKKQKEPKGKEVSAARFPIFKRFREDK
jgi:hypothetical protein